MYSEHSMYSGDTHLRIHVFVLKLILCPTNPVEDHKVSFFFPPLFFFI